jgi:hypothetical protein
MICPNCHRQINEGATFCRYCGAPVNASPVPNPPYGQNGGSAYQQNPPYGNSSSVPQKQVLNPEVKMMLIGMVVMAVALVVGIIFLVRANYIKSLPSSYAGTVSSDTVNESVSDDEEDYSADSAIDESEDQDYETDEANADDNTALLSEFGLSSDTVEDYSANLDPSQYLYYNTGIGEMSFYYPNKFFNDVDVNENEDVTEYGTNLKTISFYGSKGSSLTFSVYQRTDGLSIADETSNINQNEHLLYPNITDILVKSDSEKGRIVLVGQISDSDSNLVYDLLKIDNDNVYRMTSTRLPYESEEDRLEYAYVTENEYRMCGFSGSSNSPRSYEEFLESNP